MGIFDKINSAASKATELAGMSREELKAATIDKMEEMSEARKEKAQEKRAERQDRAQTRKNLLAKQRLETSTVQTLASKSDITNGVFGSVTIWQQQDGLVYFPDAPEQLYEVTGFSWSGPVFDQVTTSETTSKDGGKQKRTGRIIGAAVGTAVLPGVGTAIGAAYGTGNKKDKRAKKESRVTTAEAVEKETIASLSVRSVETNLIHVMQFKGKQKELSALQAFAEGAVSNRRSATPQSPQQPASDSYEELKKLKDLMDVGILTKEEFDTKKAELLGL